MIYKSITDNLIEVLLIFSAISLFLFIILGDFRHVKDEDKESFLGINITDEHYSDSYFISKFDIEL